jgi:hypothetical protein
VSDLYTSVPRVEGYKSFSVNGKAMKPKIEKGYAVVTRTWAPGDHIDMELPMVPQRVTADANISADQGRMALRYGPLIYNVERADQADLNQAISNEPLKAEWRPDVLDGVMVLDGKWADGKLLTAIPNFARMNRTGETPRETAGGDSSVNYAPGSTTSGSAANTNSTANSTSGQGQRRFRGSRDVESMVWIKE